MVHGKIKHISSVKLPLPTRKYEEEPRECLTKPKIMPKYKPVLSDLVILLAQGY